MKKMERKMRRKRGSSKNNKVKGKEDGKRKIMKLWIMVKVIMMINITMKTIKDDLSKAEER